MAATFLVDKSLVKCAELSAVCVGCNCSHVGLRILKTANNIMSFIRPPSDDKLLSHTELFWEIYSHWCSKMQGETDRLA